MRALQIGVCSWSLQQADIRSAIEVARQELGLELIQLGFFDESVMDASNDERVLRAVRDSGMEVSATCVGFAGEDYSSIEAIARTGGYRPDAEFEARLAKTLRVRDLTAALGVRMMTTHIGFVPEDRGSTAYRRLVDRLRRVSDALGQEGITLTTETGQESAEQLVQFIADVGRDNIRVNFDPANMILYGVGEPAEAVGVLGERIAHVHCKDARWSQQPGKTWGQEVPLGQGQVDIARVISKLRAVGYAGPLVIEREAGADRIADIREAIELLQTLIC